VRVVRNEKHIQSRRRLGRIFFFSGFGLLIVGLLISLSQAAFTYFFISAICLVLGLIFSMIGGYFTRRFDRGPAPLPHDTLDQALKGFDDRYLLAHYMLPSAHVLLTPNDLYVIVAKQQAGHIRFVNGRWNNPGGLRRILTWMSEEGIGNPTRDAAIEVQRLQKFFEKNFPDVAIDPQPVIIFIHPKAEVEASTSPIPAIHAKKAKNWLRNRPKGNLTREAHDALQRLLEPESTA